MPKTWPRHSPPSNPQALIKVAIIGAGPLGRWLALAAARAGYSVLLEDVMPTNLHHAQEYIRRQYSPAALATESAAPAGNGSNSANEPPLIPDPCSEPGVPGDRSSSLGWLIPGAPVAALPVAFVSTIEEAVREADLAIDCVPDELESKLEIFWLLDRMAPPRTVFATPTTRLSIADLASCTYRAEKCVAIVLDARDLAAHEQAACGSAAKLLLRTTAQTTPETVSLVREFWQRLGFDPTFELEPQSH
jgi:3-hydroxybutyryl-CoA dehydrogenase